MRRVRFALLLILPFLLLLIQGCTPKLYTFVFTEEQKLTRIDGDWYPINNDYEIGPEGLLLQDCRLCAPHYYTGDFDVTLTYEANSGATYAGIVEILLSTDRDTAASDWYGGIAISATNTDSASMNSFYNDSNSGLVNKDEDVDVSAENNKNDINVLKLIKKGSTLKFQLNGKTIGSTMQIIGNSSDINIPCIYGGGYLGIAPVVFKSFEVKYYGDQFKAED